MPGIPVGDHYPETHTASPPLQVPPSSAEIVSPRPNLLLGRSPVRPGHGGDHPTPHMFNAPF